MSSRSSSHSVTSSSSTIPPSPRDALRLRYAKDSKGHDLTSSYPYHNPTTSSSSSTSSSSIPASSRDSLKLRYAKDGKGHDFTSSYPVQFGRISDEERAALLVAHAMSNGAVRSCRDYKKGTVINRYAKDGKGLDFSGSYKY